MKALDELAIPNTRRSRVVCLDWLVCILGWPDWAVENTYSAIFHMEYINYRSLCSTEFKLLWETTNTYYPMKFRVDLSFLAKTKRIAQGFSHGVPNIFVKSSQCIYRLHQACILSYLEMSFALCKVLQLWSKRCIKEIAGGCAILMSATAHTHPPTA